MIKIIGGIAISFLVSVFGFGQNDSVVYLKNVDFPIRTAPMRANCNHGHSCCAAGCECCPELNQRQVYDTVDVTTFENGSTRYLISERYDYARSHETARIKYLFKDSSGKVTGKYFDTDEHTFKKTNDESVANDWEQIVFDADRIYFLIDERGNKLEITKYASYPLNEHLNRVSILVDGIRIQGIMNTEGKLLHRGFGYSWVSDFNGGFPAMVTETSGVKNLMNAKGELLLEHGYNQMEDLTHGYIKVPTSEGWKLLDSTGKKLNNTEFDDIGRYSDGMFWVRKKNTYGFLNTNGALVARIKYEQIWPFSNGRAAVSLNNKWGFIDKTGKLVIPIQYDDVSMFGDGRAGVATGTDGNTDIWNLIDSMGTLVTDQTFDEIYPFNGGYAVVYNHAFGSGIIDTSGNVVVSCKCSIENHNAYFPWEQNETILLVDYTNPKKPFATLRNLETGENIQMKDIVNGSRAQITNTLEWLPHYIVRSKSNEKGMIDAQGKTVIETAYDEIYVLDKSKALVSKGSKMYLYDFQNSTKKLFVDGTLELVPSTGYFKVKDVNGKSRYFDYNGNEIMEF